jgi:hemerythrin-like domain-containing protein
MTSKKGIKRHESLKDLSRHHMIGLHLALKLKRAGTEESRLTIEEIMKDADDFWNPDGQEHFREEEEILLPAYAQYKDINQPEIVEMLLEHVQIRAFFDKLLKLEDTDLDLMHELGSLLETHIRKEERVIFPMIEKALPEEKLQELEPYLH